MKNVAKGVSAPAPRRKPPFIAYLSLFLLGLLSYTAAETFRDYAAQWNEHEAARVTSPDGLVDAVLIRPLSPTHASPISLHIVPRGEPVELSDAMVRGSSFLTVPEISWSRRQLLLLTYNSGCIRDMTNLWHSPTVQGGRYYVELRASATTEFPCLGRKSSSPPQLASPR